MSYDDIRRELKRFDDKGELEESVRAVAYGVETRKSN